MAGSTRWSALVAEMQDAFRRIPAGAPAPPEAGPPAAPGAIEAAERRLGFPLPEDYRSFLAAVDGCRRFWVDLDLYSAAELGRSIEPTGPVHAFYEYYLPELPDADIEEFFGGSPDDTFPVGASRFQPPVIVVGRPGTPIAGRVVFHDGGGLARYDSMAALVRDQISAALLRAGRT